MRWEQLVGHVGEVSRDLVKSRQFKSDLKSYNMNKDSSAVNYPPPKGGGLQWNISRYFLPVSSNSPHC